MKKQGLKRKIDPPLSVTFREDHRKRQYPGSRLSAKGFAFRRNCSLLQLLLNCLEGNCVLRNDPPVV